MAYHHPDDVSIFGESPLLDLSPPYPPKQISLFCLIFRNHLLILPHLPPHPQNIATTLPTVKMIVEVTVPGPVGLSWASGTAGGQRGDARPLPRT